jgi:cysteine desulfurase
MNKLDDTIIYFDNNSTTQIDPRVLEEMMPYLTNKYANASSAHHFGLSIKNDVELARGQIAGLIGAASDEIIFTSGATESINFAMRGIAQTHSNKGKHIITIETEHKAVLETCKYLETIGFEVSYLPVKNDGLLDLNLLKGSIRPDTILISVMHVNNETGVIQPVKEISDLAHEKGAIFMSDCTQSVGKIPFNVNFSGIDILSFSAHKIYGPKGIGGLFVKNGLKKIPPLIYGGNHEKGIRGGTLNVPAIIGFGKACELASYEMGENKKNVKNLRNQLEKNLLTINGSRVNGDSKSRIFNVTNILFPNMNSNILMEKLKNVAVSNGSACTSLISEPSHVLKAMGINDEDAFSSIRFSLSKFNTADQIKFVANRIKELSKSNLSYA